MSLKTLLRKASTVAQGIGGAMVATGIGAPLGAGLVAAGTAGKLALPAVKKISDVKASLSPGKTSMSFSSAAPAVIARSTKAIGGSTAVAAKKWSILTGPGARATAAGVATGGTMGLFEKLVGSAKGGSFLSSMATPAPGSTGGFGLPRGPGGKLQWPWKDPNIPKLLKAHAIDDQYLTLVPRAPRGYIVLRDEDGEPFGVDKNIARGYGLWHAKKKPPISVRDWQALRRSYRTVRTLQKAVRMAKTVGNRRKSLSF